MRENTDKMHRRGGKRIRMDEPPPEYDNPMTPAIDNTDHYGGYHQTSKFYLTKPLDCL